MCWSLEVTISFSILDVAALLFLIGRNKGNDRLFALAFSPIALQEVGQVILWATIGTGEYSCSPMNNWVSFFTRSIVFMVPLAWTIMAVFSKSNLQRTAGFLNNLRIPLLILNVFYTLGGIAAMIISIAQNGMIFGTYAGPNHHQVWPLYNWSDEVKIALISGYTFFLFVPTLLFLRPFWKALYLVIPIATSEIVTKILLPVEWESVWCWTGCTAFIFAISQYGIEKAMNHKEEPILTKLVVAPNYGSFE